MHPGNVFEYKLYGSRIFQDTVSYRAIRLKYRTVRIKYLIKFPLGVIMENTDSKEQKSCWHCFCGEECKQYDEHAIQKSLAQGSSLCACGTCEVRVFHDGGRFTHRHTERILWSTSNLGTDSSVER